MTHLEYHLYASLFDAAAATNQYIALSLFGEVAGAALRAWATARGLPATESERAAPAAARDSSITWRVIDVADHEHSCYITVQIEVSRTPITEAA